jgi:phosphatidylinositol alpha-1,6-mannosyltransferase
VRLLLVTNDYPPKPGGIQQYLGNLVDHLDGPVRVLAPEDGPAMTATGEAAVARNRRRFMWPTPEVAAWIEQEADRFRPGAVLFGAPHPLPTLTSRLRSRLGVPVGVMCHGAEITLPAAVPGLRQALAATLRHADVRFAVSRYTQQRVERLTGRTVVYVGGGVDPAVFTPLDRSTTAERPATPGLPVVGCVSRFVPRKGQQRLIEAAARLGDRGTHVQVLLVGRGRTEASLRAQASRSRVDVRFAVDVPWAALPDLYREMDVFAMPCRSRWGGLEIEGLGLVYLEASAAGLPVLAGDSGGSPETVIPGKTGFVVHSVADLIEGLEMLLSDPVRARAMGSAGRQRVLDEYTWSAVAARMEAGFKAVGFDTDIR